jgi:hypothetical protein
MDRKWTAAGVRLPAEIHAPTTSIDELSDQADQRSAQPHVPRTLSLWKSGNRQLFEGAFGCVIAQSRRGYHMTCPNKQRQP